MTSHGLGLACTPRPRWGERTTLAEALLSPFTGRLSSYGSLVVREAGLARKWVYVVTEAGHLGIAFAIGDAPLPEEVLGEHTLGELMGLAWQHPLLSSLALAAANAAMSAVIDDDPGAVCFDCDFIELLSLEQGERVAIVGYVHKVADIIAESVGRENVVLYEDNPVHRREASERGLEARPGNQLLVELDGFDKVVATGASLVDPRLWAALLHAEPKLVGVVGPTSSFHPLSARLLGFHVIGGSYIPPESRNHVLRLVKAGYGFRGLSRLVKKWSMDTRSL